jgi:hypothetical protein
MQFWVLLKVSNRIREGVPGGQARSSSGLVDNVERKVSMLGTCASIGNLRKLESTENTR